MEGKEGGMGGRRWGGGHYNGVYTQCAVSGSEWFQVLGKARNDIIVSVEKVCIPGLWRQGLDSWSAGWRESGLASPYLYRIENTVCMCMYLYTYCRCSPTPHSPFLPLSLLLSISLLLPPSSLLQHLNVLLFILVRALPLWALFICYISIIILYKRGWNEEGGWVEGRERIQLEKNKKGEGKSMIGGWQANAASHRGVATDCSSFHLAMAKVPIMSLYIMNAHVHTPTHWLYRIIAGYSAHRPWSTPFSISR